MLLHMYLAKRRNAPMYVAGTITDIISHIGSREKKDEEI